MSFGVLVIKWPCHTAGLRRHGEGGYPRRSPPIAPARMLAAWQTGLQKADSAMYGFELAWKDVSNRPRLAMR